MEASYTWHPGACCLTPRWPLTPSILPDELFSSWLVRTAHAHGCEPCTLTDIVWPGSNAWVSDLDRLHPWANREVLGAVTGLSAQDLLACTLWPAIQLLHPQPAVQRSSLLPWILPLGCRNRSHAGGLLCCPRCIMDPHPYYRQQYRLAWHTACPRHRVLLIDRCPHCYSALQPGRLPAGHPLSRCHHCGGSLGGGCAVPALESALSFQTFADTASRSTVAFGEVSLSFSEWMCIARVMISFLKNATRQPTVKMLRFCHAIGVDACQLRSSSLGLSFEYATPAERAGLLGQAWVIMQADPERFAELAADAELPVTAFPLPAYGVPEILRHMLKALSQHPPRKCSLPGPSHTRAPLEVWHMWHRLKRRMRRHDIS